MNDKHGTPIAVDDYVYCTPDADNIVSGELWGTIKSIRPNGRDGFLATVKYGEDDDCCDFESHEIELEPDCG